MAICDDAQHAGGFEADGYAILPDIVPIASCNRLLDFIDAREHSGAGSRRLLSEPLVAEVAAYLQTHPAITGLLPIGARPVQCTLFAKTTEINWSVTPHQDLSVPVRQRVDAPGWSGWSVKEGVTFAQPPLSVLQQLIAVRLQLDPDAATTGPLEVVPGSHRAGRLSTEALKDYLDVPRLRCIVPKGGVLAMRPLLIHASGKASGGGQRRVLHFVFGPPLEGGLDWAEM